MEFVFVSYFKQNMCTKIGGINNGSGWLRAGSYFHQLIRDRRGRVSFLLDHINC